jgi:hypothetical protein
VKLVLTVPSETFFFTISETCYLGEKVPCDLQQRPHRCQRFNVALFHFFTLPAGELAVTDVGSTQPGWRLAAGGSRLGI